MPSDRARAALADILRNVDLVDAFAHHVTVEQFVVDAQRVYATTRALEIISEASRRLPDDLKARHSEAPWRSIAGVGYDVVVAEVVWQTAQTGLAALRQAVEAELGRIG